MSKHTTILASAALGLFVTTATLAQAQPSQAYQQAELAELSAEKRAEVQQRATGANTVREVLETMLLNNLQLRYPANRIVALDFGRGSVAYAVTDGSVRIANFNKSSLAITD
jgi:ABC-type transporter MlaC component